MSPVKLATCKHNTEVKESLVDCENVTENVENTLETNNETYTMKNLQEDFLKKLPEADSGLKLKKAFDLKQKTTRA